jgi:ABC-type nitrate/sulfonate/bicarbonate transport system substrate-binding protein
VDRRFLQPAGHFETLNRDIMSRVGKLVSINKSMIRLAIISEGVNTWPLYVAQSKRLFDAAGVAVEVTLTGSSAQQLEKLRRGDYDIGFQQSDHVVRAVEDGSDLFIFMAQSHAPELTLIAAPDIHAITALRGKTIIVDGTRTGYSLLLRKLFKDRGFGESDMQLTEFGGSQERFDAMKRGAGSACFINPPFDSQLLALGFNSLGTSRDFFPAYPGPIAAARRAWAAGNAAELLAFIRGFNRAYDWLRDAANHAEAVALLPDHLRIDAEFARRAVAHIYRGSRPLIGAEGLQQVIDAVWDSEGYATSKASPDKYLDLSFLQRAAA